MSYTETIIEKSNVATGQQLKSLKEIYDNYRNHKLSLESKIIEATNKLFPILFYTIFSLFTRWNVTFSCDFYAISPVNMLIRKKGCVHVPVEHSRKILDFHRLKAPTPCIFADSARQRVRAVVIQQIADVGRHHLIILDLQNDVVVIKRRHGRHGRVEQVEVSRVHRGLSARRAEELRDGAD